MDTKPITVRVRTRFDGKVFVPEEPLDMPPGTTLEGDARRPLTPEDVQRFRDLAGSWEDFDFEEPEDPWEVLRAEKPLRSQEEWRAFLKSVEGSWVGADMEDPDDPPPKEPVF